MPEAKAQFHRPPRGGRLVFGYRLVAGDVIEEDDVYDSSSGGWQKAPCAGLTLQEGTAAVGIRPAEVVEKDQEQESTDGD